MTLEGYIDFLDIKQKYRQGKNDYHHRYDYFDLVKDIHKFLKENNFQEIPSERKRYWAKKNLIFGIGDKSRQSSTDRNSFIYVELPSTKNHQKFIEDYEKHLKKIKNFNIKSFFLGPITLSLYSVLVAEKRKNGIKRCFDITYSPSFGDKALEKLVETSKE